MDSTAIVWLFCLLAIFGFSINGLLKRTVLSLEIDLITRRRDSEMSGQYSSGSSESSSSRSSLQGSRTGAPWSNSDGDRLLSRPSLTANVDPRGPRVNQMGMESLRNSTTCIYFPDDMDYIESFSDYKDLPPPDYEEVQRFGIQRVRDEEPPPSYSEYIEMVNSLSV